MSSSKEAYKMARMIAGYCRATFLNCQNCPFNVETNFGDACMFHLDFPLFWKLDKVGRKIILDSLLDREF